MEQAGFWNELYRSQTRAWRGVTDLGELPFCESARLLEAGCGNGKTMEALIDAGYRVTGVDFSEEAVRACRKLPSVSEKCCRGLYLLGIRDIDDLKGKDPDELFGQLTVRKDFYAEPCMQKMIKIAVGMANKGITRD